MERKLFIGIALLALTLAGCSNKNNNSSGGGNSNPPVQDNFYTIIWKNYDGAVLETDKNVKENTMPSYDGITPTKPEDNNYFYTWSGWNPKVVPAVANATYTATFRSVSKGTTIGTDGGQVNDANNDVSLDIPAGALEEDTTISASYIETPEELSDELSSDFLGAAEFLPSGTTFNEPVTVTINLAKTPKNSELAVFCYYEAEGIWEYVTDATPNGNKATFEVTHFSKYQVKDRTKDFLNEYTNIVRHAKANGLNDAEIIETFRNYLVNDKHIMDQYTTYNGYWYEPCGLKVSGKYKINGDEGDPNQLIHHEGESNKVGEKYGLSQIDGATSSKKKIKNASETSEIYDVTVIVEYSIIKPDIELTASKKKLSKGESATINIRCHYTNVSNFYDEYKDLELAGYMLTIVRPTNFTVNKTAVLTDSNGRASFIVTALENNKAETITVNFDVAGDFGTHAEGNITLGSGSYLISGHIREEKHMTYKIPLDETLGYEIVQLGSFDFVAEYDFEGIIGGDENGGNVVAISNVDVSFESAYNKLHHEGENSSVDAIYDPFKTVDEINPYSPTINVDMSSEENEVSLIAINEETIATVAGNGEVYSVVYDSQGTHTADPYPATFVVTLSNKANLLLDFALEEGNATYSSTSLVDNFELTSHYHGSVVTFEEWNFKILSNEESTTQTITVSH